MDANDTITLIDEKTGKEYVIPVSLLTAQIFTFVTKDVPPKTFHINTTAIAADPEYAAIPVSRLNVDDALAHYIFQNNGVEPDHMKRVMVQMLLNEDITPVMVGCFSEPSWKNDLESHVFLDGSHRYCAASAWGWSTIPAKFVPEALWMRHLADLPPDIADLALKSTLEDAAAKVGKMVSEFFK